MSLLKDMLMHGVASAIPTAGNAGRMYFATDTTEIFSDNGTSWDVALQVMELGQLVVGAFTSGNITYVQPWRTPTYKKVIIKANALVGIAPMLFPIPFLTTPDVFVGASAATITLSGLSVTGISLTGTGETGVVIVEGY